MLLQAKLSEQTKTAQKRLHPRRRHFHVRARESVRPSSLSAVIWASGACPPPDYPRPQQHVLGAARARVLPGLSEPLGFAARKLQAPLLDDSSQSVIHWQLCESQAKRWLQDSAVNVFRSLRRTVGRRLCTRVKQRIHTIHLHAHMLSAKAFARTFKNCCSLKSEGPTPCSMASSKEPVAWANRQNKIHLVRRPPALFKLD